ncbi:MAG: formylglycine-generating enzyme family protein [bacterium]
MRSFCAALLLTTIGTTLAPATALATVRAPLPAPRAAATTMSRVPEGWYRPLYSVAGARRVHVKAFALDRIPVTRGAFLQFVQAHPQWARGTVLRVFAQSRYLADWPSASSAGSAVDLERPVTGVSWFAAKAYCAAVGKRLPTLDEWELVAAASESRRDASGDGAYRRRLLALYAARKPGAPPSIANTPANAYGVRGMHGLVWEWTLDFNSIVVADDSRASGSGQDARDHHLFCASAAIGASDVTDFPAFARYAVRAGLTARSTISGVGFRCAADHPV